MKNKGKLNLKFISKNIKSNMRYEDIDAYKRMSIVHGVAAFILCPIFTFLLFITDYESIYLYLTISYTLMFPVYLFLCWKFINLRDKLIYFFINHVFLITIIFFYYFYNKAFNLNDFIFFIGLYVVSNITLKKWYALIVYNIFTISLLLIAILKFRDIYETYLILVEIALIIAGISMVVLFARIRFMNSMKEYISYLKGIMNESGTGFILLSKNNFNLLDFNNQALRIFNNSDIEKFSVHKNLFKLLSEKDIARIKELRDVEEFVKKHSISINNNPRFFNLSFKQIVQGKDKLILIRIIDNTDQELRNNLLKISEKKYKKLYNRNKYGVFTLDANSVILDANEAFYLIFEKSLEKGSRLFSLSDINQWDIIYSGFDKNELVQNYQTQYLLNDGNTKSVVFSWYLDRETGLIEGSIMDLTTIQKANQALKQSEEKFRLIYEETNDAILLLDNDKIINVNRKAIQLFGFIQDDLLNSSLFDLSKNTDEDSFTIYEAYKDELKNSRTVKFDWVFKGINRDVESEITIIEIMLGNKTFFQYVIHDNTDQNETLRAIEKSRKSLENILENNPEGIIIYSNNEILYKNPSIESVLGSNIIIDDIIETHHIIEFNSALKKCEIDKQRLNLQLDLKSINGISIEMDTTFVPTNFEEEEAVMIIFKDISSQKKLAQEEVRSMMAEKSNKELSKEIKDRINAEKLLEEQFLRTKAILDSSSNTFLLTISLDNIITSFNTHCFDYFENVFELELNQNDSFLNFIKNIISKAEIRLFTGIIKQIKKGDSKQLEVRLKSKKGFVYWLEIYFNPIFDINGNVIEISMVAHDVTEKKISNLEVEKSLRQKEFLLKEVHHRVKNNLQVISSILSLQTSFIEDQDIIDVLKESQNRIRSMSDIHEHLYRHEDFSKINFSDYLKNLCSNLLESYRTSTKVFLDYDCQQVDISLDQAIPCGLFINEVISNSLKHAWPDKDKGVFSVKLKKQSDTIYLELSDNGIGLPRNFEKMNSDSLGLQLVETLVEQLDAELDVNIENGTKYLLKFVDIKV